MQGYCMVMQEVLKIPGVPVYDSSFMQDSCISECFKRGVEGFKVFFKKAFIELVEGEHAVSGF